MSTLLRNVEVEGTRRDVRIAHGKVAAIGSRLDVEGDEEVLDGAGGVLLPGLHDHHVHLLALAADLSSVRCGAPSVSSPAELRDALLAAAVSAAPGTWLRGTGYHEGVAGPLDRHTLDLIIRDRPVRIQHRGGALWMLNSRAIDELGGVLDGRAGVERDGRGELTGRLWRLDDVIRSALPLEAPDLSEVGDRLDLLGITGVTDATPGLDQGAVQLLADAAVRRDLRCRVLLLGTDDDPGTLPAGWGVGPLKLLLHDHDLPDLGALSERIALVHRHGRAVAVHCVTREALILTIAALQDVGSLPGDRIEHAAVVPLESRAALALLGVCVVTQPAFIRERGDDYLRDVEADDLPLLYPWSGLLSEGISVAPSSDAPYGGLDPWIAMTDAGRRESRAGHLLGPAERVNSRVALNGYLSSPTDPGGPPRRVVPGAAADLCLLHTPLADALAAPHHELVRRVWHAGD